MGIVYKCMLGDKDADELAAEAGYLIAVSFHA
jgi:hypothetical protein